MRRSSAAPAMNEVTRVSSSCSASHTGVAPTRPPSTPVAYGQPVVVDAFHGCELSSTKKLPASMPASVFSAMYLLFLSWRYRSLQLPLPLGLTAFFLFASTLMSHPAANSLNSLKRSRRPSHC